MRDTTRRDGDFSSRLIYGSSAADGMHLLDPASVDAVITSPPYWGLRDYGVTGQIGLEATLDEYVRSMVGVFREVRRVLRRDGTAWLNLGDTYAGYHGNSRVPDDQAPSNRPGYVENMRPSSVGDGNLKPKDLVGVPWRVALALQADGWYLRAACPWIKRNSMPSSVTDRPTTSTEYVFLLSHPDGGGRYYYDADSARIPPSTKPQRRLTPRRKHSKGADAAPGSKVRPPNYGMSANPTVACTPSIGRNRRDTDWFFDSIRALADGGEGLLHDVDGNPLAFVVNPTGFRGAHFATMPPKLVEPMVKVSCRPGGTVLDPFSGSGTTGMVARQLGRSYIGIDLNAEYEAMAWGRIFPHPPLEEVLDFMGVGW